MKYRFSFWTAELDAVIQLLTGYCFLGQVLEELNGKQLLFHLLRGKSLKEIKYIFIENYLLVAYCSL